MSVTSIGSTSTTTSGTQVERTDGSGSSKSDFLRLLTEQLSNQDPLNPMEDKDMMAQLAQFSALEETQAMRTSLDSLAASEQMAQGASYLGKKVTGTMPSSYDSYGKSVDGKQISGVVSSVSFQDGKTLLTIGSDQMPLSNATSVETASG